MDVPYCIGRCAVCPYCEPCQMMGQNFYQQNYYSIEY
jgi:hypothetical protein